MSKVATPLLPPLELLQQWFLGSVCLSVCLSVCPVLSVLSCPVGLGSSISLIRGHLSGRPFSCLQFDNKKFQARLHRQFSKACNACDSNLPLSPRVQQTACCRPGSACWATSEWPFVTECTAPQIAVVSSTSQASQHLFLGVLGGMHKQQRHASTSRHACST